MSRSTLVNEADENESKGYDDDDERREGDGGGREE
jgi:hypothetical protein